LKFKIDDGQFENGSSYNPGTKAEDLSFTR
jgi:hypothetical protein